MRNKDILDNMDYWYHGQFRLYFDQFVALFSGFGYKTGYGRDGIQHLKKVPCKLALLNHQIGAIMRNNSDNTILSVPQITIWPQSLSMANDYRQDPTLVHSINIHEREIDPYTNKYTERSGNRYTVDRHMPIPFDLTLQVDIWTSNIDQKHQLLEQILCIFNPSIDIQVSENPIDWSAIAVMTLKDITYSSRNIPIGSDDEIDVASLTFTTVIYLNPPVRVQKIRIVERIINNINVVNQIKREEELEDSISPIYNNQIMVSGNEVTLLYQTGDEIDQGDTLSWIDFFKIYSKTFIPGTSKIRLRTSNDSSNWSKDIVGYLNNHPTDINKLVITFDLGTLPSNTMKPINAIIDPKISYPGYNLPSIKVGDRYLINDNIERLVPNPWGDGFYAEGGDVIEYYKSGWSRSWVQSEKENDSNSRTEYVLNLYNGKQLKWFPDGEGWRLSIDGTYRPGYWAIQSS